MNVLVTGGSGRIGRYVVRDFVSAGHTVLNADLTPAPDEPGEFLRVDLTQPGEVYQAISWVQADVIVHLGAWANAGVVPDSRTYGDNVRGAYNVFHAAADLGVKRVISASSAQVYGFAQYSPLYAPIDEEHPLRPLNSYALSKVVGEQTAGYFITNRELNILSFRFMGVRTPSEIAPEIRQMVKDPAGGRWLLWTRTDARDAAEACRLAAEATVVPSGPYNITGASVVLDQPSAELVATYFTGAEIRSELESTLSPLSCRRAQSAFGYRPRYIWTETQHHPLI
jgi:nucleoside-diphosphate-sugar epimerase